MVWSEHSFRRIIPETVLMVTLEIGRLIKELKSEALRTSNWTAGPDAGRSTGR